MVDFNTRVEALHQAVVARVDGDTPQSLVERAEAFQAFLERE
jgi:hypothetical protein